MTSTPQFFRALADRTRLRILNLLADGPLCVCDIQFVLAQPQSSVSRHLALLRMHGLVQDRRDGMRTFYELDAWKPGVPLGVLETLRRDLKREPEYRRDLDTLAVMKATGEYHREGSDTPSRRGARPRSIRLRSTARAGQASLGMHRGARARSDARDLR